MPRFNHFKTYFPQVNRPYHRIAKIIQAIIASHIDENGQIDNLAELERQLNRYGQSLINWANEFWAELLDRQNNQLLRDWRGAGLKATADGAQIEMMRSLAAESVHLIVTLPQNAAKVAQAQSRRAALLTGERSTELIRQLQGLSPGYPEYAARRLARTEVAKAQSDLVRVQAEGVGVTHYIWRTVGDEDVRDTHAELDGQVFAFNDPPYIEGEGRHGPGQIYNCRCYAEPIITNENQIEYNDRDALDYTRGVELRR